MRQSPNLLWTIPKQINNYTKPKPIVVDNVDEFDGHIACSTLSKSEVVIPLIRECQVIGVLDVDSYELAAFDQNDVLYLNEICEWFVSTL